MGKSTFTQESVTGQEQAKPETEEQEKVEVVEGEKPEEEKTDPEATEAEKPVEDVAEVDELLADADTPVEVELPAPHGTQEAANLGLQSDASGSYTTNR